MTGALAPQQPRGVGWGRHPQEGALTGRLGWMGGHTGGSGPQGGGQPVVSWVSSFALTPSKLLVTCEQ